MRPALLAPWPRTARLPGALALLIGLGLQACQSQAPDDHPGAAPAEVQADATTRFLAQREWQSFRLAIRQPQLGLQHQPGVLSCLDSLQADDFVPTVARLLRLALDDDARQQANGFLASPAGLALSQAVLAELQGDTQAWQRMQNKLDLADLQAQLRFTQSATGRRVLQGLGPDARAQMRELLMDHITACQAATRA